MKSRSVFSLVLVLSFLLVGCRGVGPVTPPPDDGDPIAIATADPNPQTVGEYMYFDASASHDTDEGGDEIVKWEWDWDGDGVYNHEDEDAFAAHFYAEAGAYSVQLRVTDNEGATDTLDEPLEIVIEDTPKQGWARTWGGIYRDGGYGVAADESGNIYVTGEFGGTVDFDPGPGIDEHSSNGDDDIFLTKFDSYGTFQWARTWGGPDYWDNLNNMDKDLDKGSGVAVDGSGNVYVTGSFAGTVDFDPGPGIDKHSFNGSHDAFLSKFPPDGNW
ncbi:SBBP repeat-containing protein [bacterium]|nr:SBBP repeat-containing protein [bacterium]